MVRKAVIPAAGLGTRFLPATKATPKEMIPLVDKPGIQWVVEEAVRAGITDILVVTGRGKKTIEDHFDRSPDLEEALERAGKPAAAAELRLIAELARIHYVRQPEPRGLGHAVGVARDHVGDEPFVVLLPDDLMAETNPILIDMIAAHQRTGGSVIALKTVDDDEVSLYGAVAPEAVAGEERLVRIRGMVEKPAPSAAPSRLGIMGRYLLTPAIFDCIDRVAPGAGGEIQLTDAMAMLAAREPFYGLPFTGGRYDTGNKLDWLRATVEVALTHPELGGPFRNALRDIARREGSRVMIPIEEAQRRVWAACDLLEAVELEIGEALGCVVAGPVIATEDVPPFDNTAVDGYTDAVAADLAAELPAELDVAGILPAGQAPSFVVSQGRAARIMTGAVMPEGADAVVMVEDSEELDGGQRVRLKVRVGAGDGVRRTGSDITVGTEVMPAGTALRAGHLGVLASIGQRSVRAYPRARVGVLSTGDELVDGGAPLQAGQIRESNRTMLLGAVAQANAIGVDLGTARDTEASLVEALERAVTTCDALLTSGGVSMGDFDLVKVVLDRVGQMQWMQIAIKPAKPFAFGLLRGPTGRRVPVFGLPGNPVSSLVSFELLARPALRSMMGHRPFERTRVKAIADEPLRRRPDGKVHYVRVHGGFATDGRWHVRRAAQPSHQLAASAGANGLAELPEGDGVEAGSDVDVLLLG